MASLALAAWDWQDRWWTPGREARYFLRLWLFWITPALLPAFGCLAAWAVATSRPAVRVLCMLAALPLAAGSWARLGVPPTIEVIALER